MRQGREHIEESRGFRIFHLGPKLTLECFPVFVVFRVQGEVHQFLARRQVGEPDVVIIQLCVLCFGYSARRPANCTNSQSLISFSGRPEPHHSNRHVQLLISTSLRKGEAVRRNRLRRKAAWLQPTETPTSEKVRQTLSPVLSRVRGWVIPERPKCHGRKA